MEKTKNTELKIQTLSKKRDELCNGKYVNCKHSFRDGFDAALAEVMPMMREMADIIAQTCACPMTQMTNQETCKYCVMRLKYTELVGK